MKKEIMGLHSSLKNINARIFAGDNLEKDRIHIEARLEQCCDSIPFLQEKMSWVVIEGKPYKKFLHLEDTILENKLHTLLNKNGEETSEISEVLTILHDFYSDLYSEPTDQCNKEDMLDFLEKTKSLPKIILHET